MFFYFVLSGFEGNEMCYLLRLLLSQSSTYFIMPIVVLVPEMGILAKRWGQCLWHDLVLAMFIHRTFTVLWYYSLHDRWFSVLCFLYINNCSCYSNNMQGGAKVQCYFSCSLSLLIENSLLLVENESAIPMWKSDSCNF